MEFSQLITNNAGTLSGGINVGQGEFPPAYFGRAGVANADPASCQSSNVTNLQLPYCFNLNVNVHNNSISSNSSTGDELFSATPAGAGGVSFTTGADSYKFQNNWVCGNLSTGDGGGFGHIGFIYNGDIEHNAFLFNQSTNPTIPANGGGLVIMGAPDVDPTCGATTDQDCVPTPAGSVGPSDGTGPGLVINANLIMGNSADSGTGGGIQFQAINGSDVVSFPSTPSRWNSVLVTNNIIANNVSGWDGAGVALLDGLNVQIVNNTIISNDSTASSGVLFNTLGAPLASTQGPKCTTGCGSNSAPQIAGLVSIQNSAVLAANLPSGVICPSWDTANHCRTVSFPLLANDVIFKNRSFHIGVGALGSGTTNQQAVVTLLNAVSNTPVASESTNRRGDGQRRRPDHYWRHWSVRIGCDVLGPRRPRRYGSEQPLFRCHTGSVLLVPDQHCGLHRTGQLGSGSDRVQRILQRFADSAGIQVVGLPGASGNLGCHCAQPGLQPDARRDGGRGQQLD